MKRKFLGGYLLWLALVLIFAQITGFRADSAKVMSWPIALMITPFGLIDNLLLGANEFLHKYYAQSPPGFIFADQDRWYWHYIQIYLQSNLLEVATLAFFWRSSALKVSFINSITHPIVFFGLMHLPLGYLTNVLIAEAFAVVAEGLYYRHLGYDRPFLGSLAANLVSWQFAPMLTVYFFLWDKFSLAA